MKHQQHPVSDQGHNQRHAEEFWEALPQWLTIAAQETCKPVGNLQNHRQSEEPSYAVFGKRTMPIAVG